MTDSTMMALEPLCDEMDHLSINAFQRDVNKASQFQWKHILGNLYKSSAGHMHVW